MSRALRIATIQIMNNKLTFENVPFQVWISVYFLDSMSKDQLDPKMLWDKQLWSTEYLNIEVAGSYNS